MFILVCRSYHASPHMHWHALYFLSLRSTRSRSLHCRTPRLRNTSNVAILAWKGVQRLPHLTCHHMQLLSPLPPHLHCTSAAPHLTVGSPAFCSYLTTPLTPSPWHLPSHTHIEHASAAGGKRRAADEAVAPPGRPLTITPRACILSSTHRMQFLFLSHSLPYRLPGFSSSHCAARGSVDSRRSSPHYCLSTFHAFSFCLPHVRGLLVALPSFCAPLPAVDVPLNVGCAFRYVVTIPLSLSPPFVVAFMRCCLPLPAAAARRRSPHWVRCALRYGYAAACGIHTLPFVTFIVPTVAFCPFWVVFSRRTCVSLLTSMVGLSHLYPAKDGVHAANGAVAGFWINHHGAVIAARTLCRTPHRRAPPPRHLSRHRISPYWYFSLHHRCGIHLLPLRITPRTLHIHCCWHRTSFHHATFSHYLPWRTRYNTRQAGHVKTSGAEGKAAHHVACSTTTFKSTYAHDQ